MTTRTLVIMRHAKAEPLVSGEDFDRRLTTRGTTDATAAGAWLAAEGLVPDLVICSPAARTRGTWHGVAIGLADANVTASPTVQYAADLYEAGLARTLDLVRNAAPDVETVLVIGHNPTVSALSARLDDNAVAGLRTAGIAVHDVPGEWTDLSAGRLRMSHTAR